MQAPIGIFDSGYGGLTVFRSILAELPEYDYIYLGDNGRAPYGSRSFQAIYQYTLQSVKWLFQQGCPLVVLACNTASAEALRKIQREDLPNMDPSKRVLGVIRPTAEVIGNLSKNGSVGILGTKGTINSRSYPVEISKFFPQMQVYQQACPMWVPLIENGEMKTPAADYFIQKYLGALLQQSENIDTILLACTHYPLMEEDIKCALPRDIKIVGQGAIVAQSLSDYLKRHSEMEQRLSRSQTQKFYTTDEPADFDQNAVVFFGETIESRKLNLEIYSLG